VDDWARLFVSYSQYAVTTEPGETGLEIYTLGDDLLHVGGPTSVTGFCGEHTGWIEVRARVLPGPPAAADAGWDAISEATLWCPDGELSVIGLMGDTTEGLADIAVPSGLIRVRVHARNRLDEGERTDHDPPEQHEIHIWAVPEESPWRTVLAGPQDLGWAQNPAAAASWAMLSLVPRPSGYHPALQPHLPPGPDEDRVTVVRHRPGPVEVPVGVLPAGDLEVRLDRAGGETLTWSWATAAEPIFPQPLTTLPDDEPTTVRLAIGPDGLTLRHEGVLGRDATAVGLIWDHLLDRPGSYPWMRKLRAEAAEAHRQAAKALERAEKALRRRAEDEAAKWGGSPPSDRVRGLPLAVARGLARMDRPLLDLIEGLSPAGQREAAAWAARRALRVAGLDRIGWIAEAFAAVDAGGPLPPSFTEQGGAAAFQRLLDDPDLPRTTVPIPNPMNAYAMGELPDASQQAMAFPALIALGNADPLAAAINATYSAAIAHGDDRLGFLADARIALA
jgi:hypothetical protein